MKTNFLNLPLPDGVDMSNPGTITKDAIVNYMIAIMDQFGNFCGDCKFIREGWKCGEGHRPKKYHMELGPNEFAVLRRNCKSFKLDDRDSEEDDESIARGISHALDCNAQQYA